MKAKEFAGVRVGRLTVMRRAHEPKANGRAWRCVCDCGTEVIRTSCQLGDAERRGYNSGCDGCSGSSLTERGREALRLSGKASRARQLATSTREQRSEISRKGRASQTPEQRSEISRKGNPARSDSLRAAWLLATDDDRRKWLRGIKASDREQHVTAAHARWDPMSPAERAEWFSKFLAGLSEEKRQQVMKAIRTRRRRNRP